MSGEFDRKAAAWVRKHYPDAGEIELGSVRFDMDIAAYASGAWAKFEVEWRETTRYPLPDGTELPSGHKTVFKTVNDSAWQMDVGAVIRELVEMEDPGPAYPEPGSDIPPEENGGQAGYVVGECSHRVAKSEWRAGFRNCERCGN